MNDSRSIMILGASVLQLPAILKAKEMNLRVIAVDGNKNAIGFRDADVQLEISTIDIPEVVKAAKKYQIDGIMTLASDMPIRTVAAVAKELNIVGVSEDTALKATNKASMRECLKQYQVPVPKFYRVQEYEEYLKAIHQLTGKVIVKPVDNSGSRGVFLIEDVGMAETIAYAYKYAKRSSRGGDLIVEEYMDGPEVSVETLTVEGEVHVIAITDKMTTGAPRFVEMGHSQPSQLPLAIKKQIMEAAIQAVKAIGIQNGPSHTEIIVTSEGPKIVELGARLGGDNITTHLVPLSTGVDMVKCCIELALGQQPDFKSKLNMGSAVRYFETSVGRIKDIRGIDEVKQMPGVKQVCFVKNIGDAVTPINSSADRIGFIIAQAEDAEKAMHICTSAMKKIEIILVDDGSQG